MPGEREVADLADRLVYELSNCRQRGIERLDVRTHNQAPIVSPELDWLARGYSVAKRLPALDRTAQIKYLLWKALSAMAAHNEADAELIKDLFFGSSPAVIEQDGPDDQVAGQGTVKLNMVRQSAGELLDLAHEKSGLPDNRFRDRRATSLTNFSRFLVQFCAPLELGSPDRRQDSRSSSGGPGMDPWAGRGPVNGQADDAIVRARSVVHPLRTGHVDDGERFVQLLAEAVNATIVGFTNERLTTMVEAALERKRAFASDPGAFWGSLRVVFFSTKLLDSITDERPEYPDRRDAQRQRRLAAFRGRQAVNVCLRRIRADRWTLYELPFVPPLVGTLFELPTGRRVIHLLVRNPHRHWSDHLFMEVDETSDQYFTAVFEDIVHNSVNDNKIIPVGVPREDTFLRTGSRYLHNVLRDNSSAVGWLPYALLVTWRNRDGKAEPLLQLRTRANAARELDRLTHLATHIFQDDYDNAPEGAVPLPPPSFGLHDPAPIRAAARRLSAEAGEELRGEFVPVTTGRYMHPDREHLFFFVYSREVPEDFRFPRKAEIHPIPLLELIAIVENQTLRKADLLFRAPAMASRHRAMAFEIASLNLRLHGHSDLAERLSALAGPSRADLDEVWAAVRQRIKQTAVSWVSDGEEVDIQGLSGLHYREFFSLLLPLYARIGVPGAAEQLDMIRTDEVLSAAIARLAELYRDEEIMTNIPVEL